MTNAIEQTKREMYEHLEVLKYAYRGNPKPMLFGHFDSALEAHLEELRQDSMDTLRRLAAMTKERDQIQLRLHASDHAYNESQQTVNRQMDVIASLQDRLAINARENRHAGTSGQVCEDRGASEQPDANALMIVLGALIDAKIIVTNWDIGELRAKKAMIKLESLLTTGQLRKAMKVFERPRDDAI